MSNSNSPQKVFLISTKEIEILFEKTNKENKVLLNDTNCQEYPILDVYKKNTDKLTLYDFYLNFLNVSFSFYNVYKKYLSTREGYKKNVIEIQTELDGYVDKYIDKDRPLEQSSKYFDKIFRLKNSSNELQNVFLARCFPDFLIRSLPPGKATFLTNNYWLVCYINTVMSILKDNDPENYEFYAILHNGDVDAIFKNSKGVNTFTITTYDNKSIKFNKLYSYSHQGTDDIFENYINRSTLFDKLDTNTDACDYLLEILYGIDGLGSRIELLKNSGLKKMNDQDYMYIFDCETTEVNKKKEEYEKFFGNGIEKFFS